MHELPHYLVLVEYISHRRYLRIRQALREMKRRSSILDPGLRPDQLRYPPGEVLLLG